MEGTSKKRSNEYLDEIEQVHKHIRSEMISNEYLHGMDGLEVEYINTDESIPSQAEWNSYRQTVSHEIRGMNDQAYMEEWFHRIYGNEV